MYGGIYTDLDVEPFVNFQRVVESANVSLLQSAYGECDLRGPEQYQNALMSSVPRDPFWLRLLKRIFEEAKFLKEVFVYAKLNVLKAIATKLPE